MEFVCNVMNVTAAYKQIDLEKLFRIAVLLNFIIY